MKDYIVIGIDPGKEGGIAYYSSVDDTMECVKMPPTIADIHYLFQDIKSIAEAHSATLKCVLEDVGHGIPGQSSKATAVFARHIGNLEALLTANKIPYMFAVPQKWMKALSMGSSKDYPNKTKWKNHLKERCQQMHPEIKITKWNADAILIAEYAKTKIK